jgi:hypothetical protein
MVNMEWPEVIEVSCGENINHDPVFTVRNPSPRFEEIDLSKLDLRKYYTLEGAMAVLAEAVKEAVDG